ILRRKMRSRNTKASEARCAGKAVRVITFCLLATNCPRPAFAVSRAASPGVRMVLDAAKPPVATFVQPGWDITFSSPQPLRCTGPAGQRLGPPSDGWTTPATGRFWPVRGERGAISSNSNVARRCRRTAGCRRAGEQQDAVQQEVHLDAPLAVAGRLAAAGTMQLLTVQSTSDMELLVEYSVPVQHLEASQEQISRVLTALAVLVSSSEFLEPPAGEAELRRRCCWRSRCRFSRRRAAGRRRAARCPPTGHRRRRAGARRLNWRRSGEFELSSSCSSCCSASSTAVVACDRPRFCLRLPPGLPETAEGNLTASEEAASVMAMRWLLGSSAASNLRARVPEFDSARSDERKTQGGCTPCVEHPCAQGQRDSPCNKGIEAGPVLSQREPFQELVRLPADDHRHGQHQEDDGSRRERGQDGVGQRPERAVRGDDGEHDAVGGDADGQAEMQMTGSGKLELWLGLLAFIDSMISRGATQNSVVPRTLRRNCPR
uniref:Protein kinase domain-containing protein n=1 Tax=Macrostomum lignano TaxID=282301 RepID=A0A1I8F546_9PLAT